MGRARWGWSRLSPPFQASLGGLGDSYSTNRASGGRPEDPWLHYQYSMGRSGNRLFNIQGSYSCSNYAIKEEQEEMAQEEEDIIDRYYFSRYGRNDLNLIRYGERSCFSDPKPRASLGEVPSPKSTVSLYLLSIKFDEKNFQKQNKNLLLYFPFSWCVVRIFWLLLISWKDEFCFALSCLLCLVWK